MPAIVLKEGKDSDLFEVASFTSAQPSLIVFGRTHALEEIGRLAPLSSHHIIGNQARTRLHREPPPGFLKNTSAKLRPSDTVAENWVRFTRRLRRWSVFSSRDRGDLLAASSHGLGLRPLRDQALRNSDRPSAGIHATDPCWTTWPIPSTSVTRFAYANHKDQLVVCGGREAAEGSRERLCSGFCKFLRFHGLC